MAANAVPRRANRLLRVITAGVSFVAHVLVLVHAILIYDTLNLPDHFLAQFFILVSGSAIGLLAGVFSRSSAVTISLIGFRTFCVIVATVPFGGSFVVKILLYLTIVVEVMEIHPFGAAIAVYSIVVTIIVFAQREFVAWSQSIALVNTTEWIAVSLASAGVGGLALYAQRLMRATEQNALRIRELTERTQNLVSANLNLQHQSLEAQFAAASEERRRVTRDIHDTVCYAFSCIIMMMNDAVLAVQHNDLAYVGRLHDQAMEIAREGLNDTRVSLRLFRELERYDQPLAARLQKLTNSFQAATGTNVRVHLASLPATLTSEVDEAIQRLIQESLANSIRHGHCRSVEIIFGLTDDELTVAVQDDGEGAERVAEGIGLAGMRERVELAGGRLTIQTLGVGFKVTARFPLRVALVPKGEAS